MDKKFKSRRRLSYQELVDEAAEIRSNKKILYDPNENTETIEEWLENNKPSQIHREDGAGWIIVLTRTAVLPDISFNIDRLQAEWEVIKHSKQCIKFELIHNLAVKYNDTIGKWLFQVQPADVDNIWPVIATNLVDGNLSKCCLYGKVSPRDCRYQEKQHVISVYNENFTDEEQVRAVEKELRKLGITSMLFYKTDAYTHCRIYPGNIWRLPSSIYISAYDSNRRASEIENRLLHLYSKKSSDKKKNSSKSRTSGNENYGSSSKTSKPVILSVAFTLRNKLEGKDFDPNEIEIVAATVEHYDPVKEKLNLFPEPEIKFLSEIGFSAEDRLIASQNVVQIKRDPVLDNSTTKINSSAAIPEVENKTSHENSLETSNTASNEPVNEIRNSDSFTLESRIEKDILVLTSDSGIMDSKSKTFTDNSRTEIAQPSTSSETDEETKGNDCDSSATDKLSSGEDQFESEHKLLISLKLRSKYDYRDLRPDEFEIGAIKISKREPYRNRHWPKNLPEMNPELSEEEMKVTTTKKLRRKMRKFK